MKPNKVKYTLLILVFHVLFSACATQQINLPTKIIDTTIPTDAGENNLSAIPSSTSIPPDFLPNSDECIGTFEDYAYTYGENEYYPRPDKILPLAPWEVEIEFPDDGRIYMIAGIREINSKVEIWNYRREKGGSNPKDEVHEFLIYDLITKDQTIISGEIEETDVWINRLYFADDGTIWGRNWWWNNGDYSLNSIPILSKYNPEMQRFEFDENVFKVPLTDDDLGFPNWIDIFFDEENVFWFFVPYDGLYRYNPTIGELTKQLDIPDYEVSEPILAPDGNLYYKLNYDYGVDFSWEIEMEIFQFSPSTGEEMIYAKIPESWPKAGRMLMDHTGRFWFGTFGWLDPDGTWNLMHPDLQTYYETISGSFMGFLWWTPYVSVESSNGYIWFSKHNEAVFGFAWYDPTTGDSCWFTNVSGGLEEGPDQIMWFTADDKLFKYALKP